MASGVSVSTANTLWRDWKEHHKKKREGDRRSGSVRTSKKKKPSGELGFLGAVNHRSIRSCDSCSGVFCGTEPAGAAVPKIAWAAERASS